MTAAPKSAELLACPFCGSEDSHYRSDYGDESQIECTNCGARGPIKRCYDDAIAAWNTRAAAQTPAALDAALVYSAIKHGDTDHEAWLREALDAIFEGRPVPPPRGKGISASPTPPAAGVEDERVREAFDFIRSMALNSAQTVSSMKRVEDALDTLAAAIRLLSQEPSA